VTHPSAPDPIPSVLHRHLRALARGFLPEAAGFQDADWRAMEVILRQALASRPPAMRRQLGLFVRIIGLLSLVRHGVPLARLDPERCRGLLEGLAGSPLLLVRRGTWGLRTLVFMGYYTRPEAAAAIGYRATAAGWEARR